MCKTTGLAALQIVFITFFLPYYTTVLCGLNTVSVKLHPFPLFFAGQQFPQLVKKVLTSWWTGEQAPPPLPPSPVSAKNRRFFGRGACKETLFSLENGIFRRKNRPVPTLYICTAFLMEKRQQVEPGTARSKGLRPSRALLGFLTV